MLNWHTFKNGTIIYIDKTVAADTFEHKELHPWQSLQERSLQACANATGRWRMTLSHHSLLPSISASEHQNWWSKLKKDVIRKENRVLLPPSVRGTMRAGTGKCPSKSTAPGREATACSLLGQRSTSKQKRTAGHRLLHTTTGSWHGHKVLTP